MNGAEILIDALINEGVDTVFGYPGGVVIPIFDVLYRTEKIKFILTRHEQGATHAADGYARATGKVGVCLVTSGPGATNTITGIANAKMDSVPIVVISGQVASANIGTDAFQETDMVGLTRSICKHNYLVKSVEELPSILKEAFFIARTGRPGPVAVDIPVNVSNGILEDYQYPQDVSLPGYKPVTNGNQKQIERLAQAINEAKRPLLYTGGGIVIAEASRELTDLLDKTSIPIVITLMGLGSIPSDYPTFLGMPGMHGTMAANLALTECDLLIGVGVRFDDRITGPRELFATQATIAHIDIDPAEIGKIVKPQIPVVGDAKQVLRELVKRVSPRRPNEWNRHTESWKCQFPMTYDQNAEPCILPQYVIDRVSALAPPDTIIVTDVGQHQMWAAHFYQHKKPRAFLTSGGLGTMGFGLPAAMGAAVGRPGQTVISISGDGSIQMNIQEFATCAINNIPVKTVILNNSYLGMVRQWQELFWDEHYSQTCLKRVSDCPPVCAGPGANCPPHYIPDFVKIAEANRIPGYRATQPSEVDAVLKEGLGQPGPVIMEFVVKSLENVYPMIPPGKPISAIIPGRSV
ncbi:MAG: biosynthetic-type acetolactate synthase large subunit [Candidatus Neomarinimicrobiota bacterium]